MSPKTNPHVKTWDDYQRIYRYSLEHNEDFWAQVAQSQISWRKTWNKVSDCDYNKGKVSWYVGAELNVAENCLDRQLALGRGEKKALIWVGNAVGEERIYTFRELHAEVCKMANAFQVIGLKKGDRVALYLPNIPELAISVLACARIGIIHSVIFGGFSAHSIQSRVNDCSAKIIITADGCYRGTKWIQLKETVDEAMALGCPSIRNVLVFSRHPERPSENKNQKKSYDLDWNEVLNSVETVEHTAPSHSAQDSLFILYTSGSTGTPKGVLHAMGGYLTYVAYTFNIVFQPQENDVYWCTADMGWITGHSYLLYGPLANGTTTLMFEGIPTHPDPGRFWEVVDRYGVSIFYTSPTAIRILASAGNEFVKKYSRKSIRTLGTVGEPINPEAWKWYDEKVGGKKCPIVDTWWQTETGGILISPLAGITTTKPGSATVPLPGIEPQLLDEDQNSINGPGHGALVLRRSWPGQMVGVYGSPRRFYETYFTKFPGTYFTGDQAERDADAFYWIKGRMDDVIKVSGHRLGTAEVESACITHPSVAESAAIGIPDEVTGEAISVFIVLKQGIVPSQILEKELTRTIRKEIGPLATPKQIHWVPDLPKTRSGKIMRRILKKLSAGESDKLGDLSTLADPSVVEKIVKSLKQELSQEPLKNG